ncbi:MAG: gamma-glutamyltransferase family protein [Alphaproteobacteria bacterium]|nr:gamma-glutamyltransferase family protein [Alphaproteobacteria bacterium]
MQRSRAEVVKSEVRSTRGCVVAQHPLAAEAGARLLAEGGNAVDAAAATAFAITVVEPAMSSLGGGGAALIHLARENRNVGIEFLPRVPLGASADMYELDDARSGIGLFGWPAVIRDENFIGPRSVATPGSVAGLCLMHERYGSKSLEQVLAPATELAEDGFVADWFISTMIAASARQIREFEETARIYLPDGLPPATQVRAYLPVDRFRQPDLAKTFGRIAAGGADEFYEGDTARALVACMKASGGLISLDDLARYEPVFHDGLTEIDYRDWRFSTLPGANGGTTAFETMNLLERFDVGALGFQSADALHLMACAQRAAFLDRFSHMADPDRIAVPLEGLLSKDYAGKRAGDIRMERAGPTAVGDPWPFDPATPRSDGLVSGPLRDAGCTTHLCATDPDGNMVSLTNTLGDLWGSFVAVPGTGVMLNDGMIWFNPVAGHINSIEPGKMPLSNLTAVLGHSTAGDGVCIGAPGGRKVITSVLQSLINMVDHGRSLQDAIAAPRLHCEGDVVQIDDRIDTEVRDDLTARGHGLEALSETHTMANFARPVGIRVDVESGLHLSGVDALRPAAAAAP